MPNRSRSVVARKMARALGVRRYRGRWNLRELLDDCESCAWELEASAPPHVTPGSIAFRAVQRVAIGRQHKQSVRCILTSRFDRRAKRPENLRQIDIHLHDLAAVEGVHFYGCQNRPHRAEIVGSHFPKEMQRQVKFFAPQNSHSRNGGRLDRDEVILRFIWERDGDEKARQSAIPFTLR